MAHDPPPSHDPPRSAVQPLTDPRGDSPDESAASVLAELLHRVGQGQEDAFSDLYDRTSSLLFALVKRVVRDVSISEEVLQEVFVEIWKQAPRFDARRGSAHGWICTIAHRRAVDTVRSVDASRRRDSAEGLRALDEKVVDVQEEGIMRVESQRVATAMLSLTPLQSDAIRLAYFSGCSHREVAEILDIPLGTAKTRIRDGMIVLRDSLGVTS
ncbi:sigma-70 family RNA polymerase sigma factor [Brachybacterium tyrofermentans]|uniref:sigma-70 family RNA polymerase sigma factor n=1 Tax=Brachybacterium tyrofermentans TaxID=47848 RepID=UPI003FD31643